MVQIYKKKTLQPVTNLEINFFPWCFNTTFFFILVLKNKKYVIFYVG